MDINDNIREVNSILDKYNLSSSDRKIFWDIIYPIFIHEEFQRRMNPEVYPHHDKISLGNHIISDAAVSFILAKRKKDKNKDIDIRTTVLVAMFHDLYELPWQNVIIPRSMYVNKHGFTHPIEAIINASTWYPEYFNDSETASKIVDGVVHHMWPFPVRAIDSEIEKLDLNNPAKWYLIDEKLREMITASSMRSYFKKFHVSICRSLYDEGKTMSDSDKIVSISNIESLNGVLAFVTGKNPDVKGYKK